MNREEIGNLIAEYPGKKDTHELWRQGGCIGDWFRSERKDPIDIPSDSWARNCYELREKRRELDQSIFEGAPEWVDIAYKTGGCGAWRLLGGELHGGRWLPKDLPMDPQPTGLDHVPWQESKLRRST